MAVIPLVRLMCLTVQTLYNTSRPPIDLFANSIVCEAISVTRSVKLDRE